MKKDCDEAAFLPTILQEEMIVISFFSSLPVHLRFFSNEETDPAFTQHPIQQNQKATQSVNHNYLISMVGCTWVEMETCILKSAVGPTVTPDS